MNFSMSSDFLRSLKQLNETYEPKFGFCIYIRKCKMLIWFMREKQIRDNLVPKCNTDIVGPVQCQGREEVVPISTLSI